MEHMKSAGLFGLPWTKGREKSRVMKRILLIDDDELVYNMILQMLSSAGYEAEDGLDGNKGLKFLQSPNSFGVFARWCR